MRSFGFVRVRWAKFDVLGMPKTHVVDEQPLRIVPPPAMATGASGSVNLPPSSDYVVRTDMAVLRAGLGSRQQIQDELDDIASAMRSFHLKAPDQVMRECGAYGARLTEMCVLLHRVEDLDRQYTRIRTMQVQRYLDELERQTRIASRLIEVSRQDLALLGGSV